MKIGVLNDLSGIYSDLSGQGSVTAARMAIEEWAARCWANPSNWSSPTTRTSPTWRPTWRAAGSTRARSTWWHGLPDPSTALADGDRAAEEPLSSCPPRARPPPSPARAAPLTAQWTTNTYALAAGTARALVKEGKKTWYFITADYTFGHSLEKDATEVIKADGGSVVGSSRHPFPGNDFSSFLLKAQASKADVIALANAGNDTVNAIKQANEYGITRKQVVAPLLTYISDVHSIGLDKAQGMYLSEAFYWDFDERSRAWSRKFFEKQKRMPTAAQAGVYSATLSYLKAIQAAGTDEAKAVMAQLRKMTIDDAVIRKGKLREDGALVHDMLLLQVKTPAESSALGLLQGQVRAQGRRRLPAHQPRLPGRQVIPPCARRRATGHAPRHPGTHIMFDIPMQSLLAQLLVGLINGCFYAMLSMGLAIDFRPAQHHQLRARRAVHGGRLPGLDRLSQLPLLLGPEFKINFWAALVLAPVIVGGLGVLLEKTLLKRLYHLDHLYGLLLTFGVALVLEGAFRYFYGISGAGYDPPALLQGGVDLGFMYLPLYRGLRGGRLDPDLRLHLVPVREDPAGRPAARRHREPQAAAGLRRQHPADGPR